eukprot:TRINITY_DN2017_c0_g1_i1.p1 TRINITY_DN2017_c0_g1~~TRINITY_DN2017_c0_g1_i1.p1  ORF type:complete len:541 (+),score=87.72 TRINITY_DN2017_c0_g1_i1:184-1623(+)
MNDSIQQFDLPQNYEDGTNTFAQDPSDSMISPLFDALKLSSSITTLDLSNFHAQELSLFIADVIMMNNTITDLNLSYHRFGQEITNAIRINSTIQTLNISSCGCGDQVFENTRGTSPSLTSLNLSGNSFEFTHVAEWLKHNVNLTSLTLSGSQLEGNGKEAFCKWFPKQSALTELELNNVSQHFEGAEACLKNHRKFRRFTFHNASYWSVTEGGLSLLESLSFNKDLCYLDLSRSFLHREYSALISQLIDSLPLLTELHLRLCELDHNMIEPLRKNSMLTTLDLYDCFPNENDMVKMCEALHNHPTLTSLNLGTSSYQSTKNKLSAITKLLQTRIPLRSLYLDDEQQTHLAIEDLVEVLKTNHTLTFLSLSGIQYVDQGAIALAECLTVNTTLIKLNLRDNGIKDDGMIAIAQSLERNSSLKTLNMAYNFFSDGAALDSILQMLDINTTLTTLIIFDSIELEAEQRMSLEKKYGKRLVI